MEFSEPTTRTSASSSRRDLKQSHSTRTKRKAIANIQQSCSDSPAIANPMDGVFGTDRMPYATADIRNRTHCRLLVFRLVSHWPCKRIFVLPALGWLHPARQWIE